MLKFKATQPYGLAIAPNTAAPTEEQAEDETVVNKTMVSVTAMQVGFEAKAPAQLYLRLRLYELFRQGAELVECPQDMTRGPVRAHALHGGGASKVAAVSDGDARRGRRVCVPRG